MTFLFIIQINIFMTYIANDLFGCHLNQFLNNKYSQ